MLIYLASPELVAQLATLTRLGLGKASLALQPRQRPAFPLREFPPLVLAIRRLEQIR